LGGITGIVHFRGEPPSRDQVQQLSAGVAHRGPDDKNVFYAAPIALAQRVFATEKNVPKPPFVSDRFVILIDGSADRDRTLEEWANKGPGALSTITNGFALAVWDQKERVLWLARDPAGTRPLFFSHKGSKFAFASTLRPLLGLPWVSREIASDHLTEYLSFRYTHAPRTLLRDVQSVPPGHVVRIDSSGVRIDRWWNPPWWSPGQTIPEFPMIADRIDTALRRAVERRLRTVQPTGVLLSGGLDSAAILHHATDILGYAPDTFTVTMAGDKRDESAFAARVAETYGATHSLIKVTTEEMISSVELATLEMGQPLPSPAALVQHCLFQQVKHETRILLSGAGGDEVLGGRTMPDIAQRLRRARTVGRLPGPARSMGRRLAKRAGWSDLASSAPYFGLERKIGGSRVFSADDRVALLSDPAMARPGIRATILEPIYQEVTSDPINEMLHVWQRGWLTEDVLARADRLAANNRLRIRFPLLDSEFLATAASIPGFEKCRRKGVGYISKAPLRHAMQGRLSDQLLHRPKRSEPRPMAFWLRGQGSPFLRERIDALCDQSADLFVPSVARQIMEEHLSGRADHSVQLWTLVMFDAWRASLG